MGSPVNDLHALVDAHVTRHYGGTYRRLSDKLSITLSALLRGLRAGTLAPETCLLLAKELGEPPTKVLTAAGKGEVAALIESLYGKANRPLSDVDQRLVGLPSSTKRMILTLVEDLQNVRVR